jgi:hypothetical protein
MWWVGWGVRLWWRPGEDRGKTGLGFFTGCKIC